MRSIGGDSCAIKINLKKLLIIREWTELTQQDFAKSINRSSKTIEGYEYGKINYNFDTFMKICKKHGIEIIIKKK